MRRHLSMALPLIEAGILLAAIDVTYRTAPHQCKEDGRKELKAERQERSGGALTEGCDLLTR